MKRRRRIVNLYTCYNTSRFLPFATVRMLAAAKATANRATGTITAQTSSEFSSIAGSKLAGPLVNRLGTTAVVLGTKFVSHVQTNSSAPASKIYFCKLGRRPIINHQNFPGSLL